VQGVPAKRAVAMKNAKQAQAVLSRVTRNYTKRGVPVAKNGCNLGEFCHEKQVHVLREMGKYDFCYVDKKEVERAKELVDIKGRDVLLHEYRCNLAEKSVGLYTAIAPKSLGIDGAVRGRKGENKGGEGSKRGMTEGEGESSRKCFVRVPLFSGREEGVKGSEAARCCCRCFNLINYILSLH